MTLSSSRLRYEYRRRLPLPCASASDGPDEVGAGPVVELAVGDPHDLGRPLAAEALGHGDLLVDSGGPAPLQVTARWMR